MNIRPVRIVAFYIKPCVHLIGMFGDVWQSEEADTHEAMGTAVKCWHQQLEGRSGDGWKVV